MGKRDADAGRRGRRRRLALSPTSGPSYQVPPQGTASTLEISGRSCSDQREVQLLRLFRVDAFFDRESDEAMHTARLGTAAACNPSTSHSPGRSREMQGHSPARSPCGIGHFTAFTALSPHCAVSKGRTTPQSLANPIVPPDEERGQGYAEKQTMFSDHRGQG